MLTTRRIAHALLVRAAIGAAGVLAFAPLVDAAPKRVKVPIPRPRPSLAAPRITLAPPLALVPTAFAAIGPTAAHAAVWPSEPMPVAPTATTSTADLAGVKHALALIRSHRQSEASAAMQGISDPLARKLVEWLILRLDENHGAGFARYVAFVRQNPTWPSVDLLRRRAEAALWDDKAAPATIDAYFRTTTPLSAKGHLAYARALVAHGDKASAAQQVRLAWQLDALSPQLESMVLETFPGMLRPEDHKSRMLRRLYADDSEAGLRAARLIGEPDLSIAKAWVAVIRKSRDAGTLLDAVPSSARSDAGYVFCLARWLRHSDRIAQAGQVMLSAPRDPAQLLDTDQWWIERRLIARKLLDIGDARTAYLVARDAAPPEKGNYRVDHEFTAGWIALRFLNDPATALAHFTRIARSTTNPTALARAGYWRGRAAEALGRAREARAYYAEAARVPTSYYGQLARAHIGEPEIALASPPLASAEQRSMAGRLEVVRAVEILYAIGEPDLVVPIAAEFARRGRDMGMLTTLAEIAQRHHDARALLLIGKGGLDRGHAFDQYAFPTIGVPRYEAIGPHVDPSVVYSIVRQESAFNPKDVSSADALGLMQVTPEAGRYIARKFRVGFDRRRLLHDQAYNVQMGSAELGDLLKDYRGSYILAFAAYNAGRGRVRDWIARYGDPREPNVDPIDWVERIPFSETRNYVERVMENMQVYRVRFGGSRRLLIEADLRRGGTADN